MKRTISLWLGLLAFALLPALAQKSAPTGKIHGHVINPTGAAETVGSVSLSTDGGHSSKYTFPLSSNGDYSGDVAPGTYTVVFRLPETPSDRAVDSVSGVKIVADQDVAQDIDMSRKEFVDKLPEDQKKQLEEYKKRNSETLKVNEIIKGINADLAVVTKDIKDAEVARATASQELGATATKADLDAKEAEIKTAKYTEIVTLMTKDVAAKPEATVLWAQLGQAQLGLKKYDDAETTYKKVLDLEAVSKKPNPSIQGLANSGLGEVYARAGKIPEANAAYDAAAKINPSQAGFYLRNQAVIYFQMNNPDAQIAAAELAIKADPAQPLPYYLKGQGLIQKATFDAKTGKLILPPGCSDAYHKYLELAPNGTYSAEVKGILSEADQKINSSFDTKKKK